MRTGQARRLARRGRDKDCRARADHPGWQPDADGYAHARSLTHGALFFDQARAPFDSSVRAPMPGLTRAGGVVCDAQAWRSAADDALIVGSALASRACGAWCWRSPRLARASLSSRSDLGCRRCPVRVGDGADVDDEARSRGPACLDPTICVGCAYPTHAPGLPGHRRKVRFDVKHLASHFEPTECAFGQGDMPMIRWQMVHEIIMGAIR